MTITSPVTLIKLRNTFGGAGRMSEYRRGAGLVPDIAANGNISTGVEGLRLSTFLNATAQQTLGLSSSSSTWWISQPWSVNANFTVTVSGSDGSPITFSQMIHYPPDMGSISYAGGAGTVSGTTQRIFTYSGSAHGPGSYPGLIQITATQSGRSASVSIDVMAYYDSGGGVGGVSTIIL